MTTYDRPLFEGLTEEQIQQVAEAAAKAGMSIEEAVTAINEKLPALIAAFTAAIPQIVEAVAETAANIIELANEYGIGLEARMKEVATPKEWHLMNHAKKARTRKKYRNRLLRRLKEGGSHADPTT